MKIISYIFLVIVATLVTSCSKKDQSLNIKNVKINSGHILATVGDSIVTVEDLQKESSRRRAKGMPFIKKEDLLQGMVDRLAILHQAKSVDLINDPDIQRSINNLLVSKFIASEQEEKLRNIEVTDIELKEEYTQRIDEFTKEAMSRISLLKLSAGKNASEVKMNEIRTKMQSALELVKNAKIDGRGLAAKGFGDLAVRFSEDQASRYKGGDIGWRIKGKEDSVFPQEIIELAHELNLGATTDVIEIEGVFYIAKKTDHRAKSVKEFSEVKSFLRQKLLQSKREQIQNSFRQRARDFAGVNINYDHLSQVNDLPVFKSDIVTKPFDPSKD